VQQVRSTPLLHSNRYGCLDVEEYDSNDIDDQQLAVPKKNEKPERAPKTKKLRWEKRLPKRFVLTATLSSNSFKIPVELQTTDTQEVKAARALLDCGASG
jgi:hypothetical protein